VLATLSRWRPRPRRSRNRVQQIPSGPQRTTKARNSPETRASFVPGRQRTRPTSFGGGFFRARTATCRHRPAPSSPSGVRGRGPFRADAEVWGHSPQGRHLRGTAPSHPGTRRSLTHP
jgi:hypothetical protein